MDGRLFLRLVAALALVGLLAVIGVSVYNAGVTTGLAEAGAFASGAPAPYYPGPYAGHGWGGGWAFAPFAIFFWILGIFLVFALVRAAFGFGRWGGRNGGWGRHEGYRAHLDDWHRQAHDAAPDGPAK